ncbi:MAG: carboxypeptidase M32 [Vicinamibacterales bacterium]
MTAPHDFVELKKRLGAIHDLRMANELLSWDQVVMMPAGGASSRAEQMATLETIAHERFTSAEIGQLLDRLAAYEQSLPHESDEACLIRQTRVDYDKARKVPTELSAEMTRVSSLSRNAWAEARAKSDFSMFEPHLVQMLDLKKRYVDLFQPTGDPYDVVLDDYERAMPTAEVAAIFAELKKAIVPLIAAIAERKDRAGDACLHGHFPKDAQRAFCLSIVKRFGFSDEQWRLDPTTHPFATNTGLGDIRITTRYYEDFLSPSLFGTMHECGHGLYEHGVSPSLERTPVCQGASLGLHESQSRLWENIVGRSRPFWRCFYPQLQAAFPDQFREVDLETFYRAVNTVQPGFIRVEADELTYGLHVILRFELERDMLAGRVQVKDLPRVWNERMREYLGVDVPNDAKGVLQDVHWSLGLFGYFPTYALGTIISAQIWERALAAMPDLPAQFERGEFSALREWLRTNLHCHGRKFTPKETLEKVTGSKTIDVGPFVAYVRGKFGDIYGV